jgi:hypothetical protein
MNEDLLLDRLQLRFELGEPRKLHVEEGYPLAHVRAQVPEVTIVWRTRADETEHCQIIAKSGLARPIGILPIVRNAGIAEHEAHEIGEARLSPDIVGEQQHAPLTALQADEAVGGLPVVAAFVESAALGPFEHDHPQSGREVWPLFGLG